MNAVIVTGAGGFIGGALTHLLLERGVTVYGIDISEKLLERHKEYERFVPITADFSRYGELAEILPTDADVFYHFAWQGVFGEAFKDYTLQLNNAKYACDALMAAAKCRCKKFVFSGTYNEIEVTDFLDLSHENPRYTCIYSGSKTAAEILLKTLAANNGILYSSGLTAMSYGENNRSKMLAHTVLCQLIHGESPKLIEGNIPYDMVYIDDIAKAFFAIGERGVHLRSYYIGHRNLRTFRELLTEVGQIVAPDVPMLFGAYPDDNSNRHYDAVDLEALYRDTGFECTSDFRESILKTVRWLKEEDM